MRWCTTCLGKHVDKEAVYVAADKVGLEWFECADHDCRDNLAGVERTTLTPIEDWFNRAGIPFEKLDA
jgi:hypothetical protein